MYSIQEQFRSEALALLNSKVVQTGQIVGNFLEISHEIGVLNVRTGKASAIAVTSAMQKLLAASTPVEFFQTATSVIRPDIQFWNAYAVQLRGIAVKITAFPGASIERDGLPKSMEDGATMALEGVALPAILSDPVPVELPVLDEPSRQTLQQTEATLIRVREASAPAVDMPPVVQEVKKVIENIAKVTPVIPAGAEPAAPLQALSKSAVVSKTGTVKVSGKHVPPRKSAPPARSSGRSKKS